MFFCGYLKVCSIFFEKNGLLTPYNGKVSKFYATFVIKITGLITEDIKTKWFYLFGKVE